MKLNIKFMKHFLLDYSKTLDGVTPVMATFTTRFTSENTWKIVLRGIWDRFRLDMRELLPHRLIYFPVMAWSIEPSFGSWHVHVIMQGEFSVHAVQKLWKKYFPKAGHVNVEPFDTWFNVIEYVFKSYDHFSPYIGQCVSLPSEPISTM